AAPTVDLVAASDSGTSSTDDKTNVVTPTIRVAINTGVSFTAAVAGDTVKLFDGATQVGTAILSAANITAGFVDITSSTLTAGSHSLTATVTDAATNVSAASAALAVTIDTTAPLLASATVNAATVVLTYTEAGVGMAGLTPAAGDFAVTKNGATPVAVSSVVVDTVARTLTLTLASAVTNADAVTVSYTPGTNKTSDIAGNNAVALVNQGLTNNSPDTTAPAAPTLDLVAASDSGTSNVDDKTNVVAPTIRVAVNTGSGFTAAVAGDTVKLFDGATQVGTAVLSAADITAGFVDITSAALASGNHSLTSTVTDAAANTSASSAALLVAVDTTAP